MTEARRFLVFLCVGLLNTVFGYAVFALVFFAMGSHRVAIVAATILGVLFNFATTGRLVFGRTDRRALLPFIVLYGALLLLNLALVEGLSLVGLSAWWGQVIALPVLAVTSYAINAAWVFRRQDRVGRG